MDRSKFMSYFDFFHFCINFLIDLVKVLLRAYSIFAFNSGIVLLKKVLNMKNIGSYLNSFITVRKTILFSSCSSVKFVFLLEKKFLTNFASSSKCFGSSNILNRWNDIIERDWSGECLNLIWWEKSRDRT